MSTVCPVSTSNGGFQPSDFSAVWFMTSDVHWVQRNHTLPGTARTFMIHSIFRFKCRHLCSAKFWCWKCGSACHCLICSARRTSLTRAELSSDAESAISVSMAPRFRMTSSRVLTNSFDVPILYTSITRDLRPTNTWQYVWPFVVTAATAAYIVSVATGSLRR